MPKMEQLVEFSSGNSWYDQYHHQCEYEKYQCDHGYRDDLCLGPGLHYGLYWKYQIQISPLSFYQVNPVQTRKLYETALEYAGLKGNETVWDLYCGIGTISLFLAQKAGKVYGVEIVPEAIADAKINAKLNGITNAEFFVGKAEEILPEKYKNEGSTLMLRRRPAP